MTRDGLQRALIDLGWLTLIHRVFGGKPAESYALYQLMRAAGRPVPHATFVDGYGAFTQSGGAMSQKRGSPQRSGTSGAIVKRIEHLRAALADLGIVGAIVTVQHGQKFGGAYMISKADARLIEDVILGACGFELEDAA